MKKRFALAVSMINDPPDFIFDEVLNGLDPQGIALLQGAGRRVQEESQGGALLVAHTQ
jgi:ABC-2 type transport system ATP-binding protein